MLRSYYVVVSEPRFKEEIHKELLAENGSDTVPDRSVEHEDLMPFSEYNGIFLMTDAEAERLSTDFRVTDVHLSAEDQGFSIVPCGTKHYQYDKNTATQTAAMKNWALGRCISPTENFGTAVSTSTYTYTLTGKGVDVVIMDTGIEPSHPEFAVNPDGTGGTRVVSIDWTAYGVITSTPTGGFLGDCDGHGSNCASIAAGNTCGWASDSAIYSMRIVGTGLPTEHDILDGRVLGLVNEIKAWQTLRLFHLGKAVDPSTGYRRPTIVSCSYAYLNTYTNLKSITYRGVASLTTTTNGILGALGPAQGNSGNSHGVRYAAVEAEIASVIAAGIIVVGAAGNDSHKIEVPAGVDYNNYWTNTSNLSSYYHRGATPGSTPGVICVGAVAAALPEHKVYFSCAGPRVNIFAPGYYVMGAWSSSTYAIPSVQDPRNSLYYFSKISGTSQACPQVTGVGALLLELRPWMNSTDVTNVLSSISNKNQLNESYYGQTGTYTNSASLQSGPSNYLYMAYNQPIPLTIT
jgi:subtilisin family serine protease